jgi:hypothetical protein
MELSIRFDAHNESFSLFISLLFHTTHALNSHSHSDTVQNHSSDLKCRYLREIDTNPRGRGVNHCGHSSVGPLPQGLAGLHPDMRFVN